MGTAEDELREFDAGARLAVALAESEAERLGHEHVGTEHLLLGLLAETEGRAARELRAAGVSLGAARHKASEAVGATESAPPSSEPRPRTARAARALGRSVRFAHVRKADLVATEDVLLGVLDVEGTAGQVLRGLDVDLDRLRTAIHAGPEDSTPPRKKKAPIPSPSCPTCSAGLDQELTYRPVQARGERSATRDVIAYSCGACGRLLGITPA